ncbi:hypothetical protein BDN70DRAFT_878991, partial [Pholiota conissans]
MHDVLPPSFSRPLRLASAFSSLSAPSLLIRALLRYMYASLRTRETSYSIARVHSWLITGRRLAG